MRYYRLSRRAAIGRAVVMFVSFYYSYLSLLWLHWGQTSRPRVDEDILSVASLLIGIFSMVWMLFMVAVH